MNQLIILDHILYHKYSILYFYTLKVTFIDQLKCILLTCFPTDHVSVHAGSRPTVQYVASLSELPQALQPYYTQGYVLAALHPIILSVGRTRSLPFSLLYRAILARPRPRYEDPYPVLNKKSLK